LKENGLMNSKFVDKPMDSNAKLLPNQGKSLSDPEMYKILVGKLNYLIVTRLDISFVVIMVSQFLNSPCVNHLNVVMCVLKYTKGSPEKCLLNGHNNHTKIVCYSDAIWAGSPIISF